MPRPQAVIFDIGNVLIQWQPEKFYDSLMSPEQRKRLFAAVDLHHMNEQIDRGAPFRKTVYDAAAAHPDLADMIRLWHDRWTDLAAPAIAGSARLNQALRAKGIMTAILSNIGQETFDLATAQYPFLNDFHSLFLSGPMGVTKPDPMIYQKVEAALDLPPEALLFTDDRQENIDAATARGWQGHHFKTAEGFANCLVAHGLLTEAEVRP